MAGENGSQFNKKCEQGLDPLPPHRAKTFPLGTQKVCLEHRLRDLVTSCGAHAKPRVSLNEFTLHSCFVEEAIQSSQDWGKGEEDSQLGQSPGLHPTLARGPVGGFRISPGIFVQALFQSRRCCVCFGSQGQTRCNVGRHLQKTVRSGRSCTILKGRATLKGYGTSLEKGARPSSSRKLGTGTPQCSPRLGMDWGERMAQTKWMFCVNSFSTLSANSP